MRTDKIKPSVTNDRTVHVDTPPPPLPKLVKICIINFVHFPLAAT